MSLPLDESAVRHLHHELEMTIRDVNRALIGRSTGAITRSSFTNVARMVAHLRGRYLERVLALGEDSLQREIGTDAVLQLRPLREAYVEAIEGFAALEHALQRGYVSLTD